MSLSKIEALKNSHRRSAIKQVIIEFILGNYSQNRTHNKTNSR